MIYAQVGLGNEVALFACNVRSAAVQPRPICSAGGYASTKVDEAIVQEGSIYMCGDTQSKLLSWARDMIDTHDTFLNVFLRASVILPASQQHAHPSARCLLPRLHRAVLERVSWFAGVEVGRRMRNVSEFKEMLEALDQEESDDSADY